MNDQEEKSWKWINQVMKTKNTNKKWEREKVEWKNEGEKWVSKRGKRRKKNLKIDWFSRHLIEYQTHFIPSFILFLLITFPTISFSLLSFSPSLSSLCFSFTIHRKLSWKESKPKNHKGFVVGVKMMEERERERWSLIQEETKRLSSCDTNFPTHSFSSSKLSLPSLF